MTRQLRLAAQENLLPGADLIEKWEFARAAGLSGIELLGGGGGTFRARLPELRRARDAGVPLPTVCVAMDHFIGDFDPGRRASAVEGINELSSVMAEIGGSGVITPAAFGLFSRALPPFTPPRSAEQTRADVLAGILAIGEHAAEVGVTILLEPLNRFEDYMINTVEQAAAYCRESGLGSVRLMADFFHMNIEERDIAAALRAAVPYLAHVHLADSSRLEPGTGHLDFDGPLDVLQEIGYDGWYTLECGLSGEATVVLPRVVDLLRG